MLPARTRMRRGAEFATTVRRGRRGSARAVVVHVVRRPPVAAVAAEARETADAQLRIGFVVTRAVGPAVVRNRVRRRLRHLLLARLTVIPAGAQVVVRANPGAAVLSSAALGRDLDLALTRALAPDGTRA